MEIEGYIEAVKVEQIIAARNNWAQEKATIDNEIAALQAKGKELRQKSLVFEGTIAACNALLDLAEKKEIEVETDPMDDVPGENNVINFSTD